MRAMAFYMADLALRTTAQVESERRRTEQAAETGRPLEAAVPDTGRSRADSAGAERPDRTSGRADDPRLGWLPRVLAGRRRGSHV